MSAASSSEPRTRVEYLPLSDTPAFRVSCKLYNAVNPSIEAAAHSDIV
jgi:hypothetical protein